MTTFAQYVQSLLNNVTQTYGHNGETGVDVGLPYGSPVYALTSGRVIGSGYYAGGGVETIQGNVFASNYTGTADTYYQHLSQDLLRVGQYVQAGQLIGYSGGQIGYGSHPSTRQFSSGPHIEVGINAPYGGMWGSGAGPNVNPLPWLQGLPHLTLASLGSAPSAQTGQSLAALSLPNFALPSFGLPSFGPTIGSINGAASALSPIDITNAVSTGVGKALAPITVVIQDMFAGILAGVADALKRAGWFLIALGVMAAGVWLLLTEPGNVSANAEAQKSQDREDNAQAKSIIGEAREAGKGAGKRAAVRAAMRSSGGSAGAGDGSGDAAGESAGEGAEGASEAAGAAGGDAAELAAVAL